MRGRGIAFLAGRAAARNNQQSMPQESTSSLSPNQADQLEKLVEMHTSGALSDEEFTQAKKKLLSGSN